MALVLRRLALSVAVLLGAWALGVVLCLVKGEGGGLAMAVGNLSAPYVIVAVAAGLTARRWWLGALVGIVATEATVSGFYGTWGAYFGHEVSHSAVMLWGGAGLLSGALFGLCGWAARSRPRLRYVLPALLLLEPAATQIGFSITSPLFHIGYAGQLDARDLFAYSVEIAAGVVAFVIVRWNIRARRRSAGALAAG